MSNQEYICGGSGVLTPGARAELDAFRNHLFLHPRGKEANGCRFCNERILQAAKQRERTPTNDR